MGKSDSQGATGAMNPGICKWHDVPLVTTEDGENICVLSAAILASRRSGKRAMGYLSWRTTEELKALPEVA